MNVPDTYRRYAEECLRHAEDPDMSPDFRSLFQGLAARWIEVAEVAERQNRSD